MESLFALLVGAFVLWVLIFVGWRGSKIYHDLNPGAQRDFRIGFLGIIVLNTLLCPPSLILLRGDGTLQETRATMALALPWVVNLVLLVFFAFYRRWIALGALALGGLLLALAILARVLLLLWGVDFPRRTEVMGYLVVSLLPVLLSGLAVLLIGAAVLGPPILLWRFWRKVLADSDPSDQKYFFVGFFGIISLNVFLYPISLFLRMDSTLPETRAIISLALPWVVNLALLTFFTFYRRWIALGALALVGSLLAWVVLSGVFFYIGCFVLILGGGALTGIVSFFAYFFGAT
jgi:hypothetical protein